MIRWKKKEKINYVEGDVRIVRRFLFWPICIGDEWRWFGVALIKQRMESKTRFSKNYGVWYQLQWTNREWIN